MPTNRITGLSRRVRAVENRIKSVQSDLKPKSVRPTVCISSSEVIPKKAAVQPNFTSKTVLTDSTWRYVEIFLKENGADEALFYWEQAYNFYKATESLSLVSAPLTTYYTFLNATKSLLIFKSVGFDDKHGVSGKRVDGHYNLQNEKVILKPKGIVSSLSNYLKEPIPEPGVEYDLKLILSNLEYIHRAYHLTYGSSELFIPIINPRFVHDKHRKKGWFEAQLEPEHSSKSTVTKLIGFGVDQSYDNSCGYTIRRNKVFVWDAPRNRPTEESLKSFSSYHLKIRKQLRYIYSPNNIWYIKRKDLKNCLIDRGTLPLTFIAMHRLSELSRYHPQMLNKHLERKASWLLSEFITKSMVQFIDQISSEMTGVDFRMTGFRA
ncbi:MAG: YaaC family protein [Sedimenticola sp.]